jgi:hypothetical protein
MFVLLRFKKCGVLFSISELSFTRAEQALAPNNGLMETSDMTLIRGTFPFPQLYAIWVNRKFTQDETNEIFSRENLFFSAALAVICLTRDAP